MSDKDKFDPKELAKQVRKKAYQKAKEFKKALQEKQKSIPITSEQQERIDAIKLKAKTYRQEKYQKEKLRKQLDKKISKEKTSIFDDVKRSPTLSFNRLKLVKYDGESGDFVPLKTVPPVLKIISNDDS